MLLLLVLLFAPAAVAADEPGRHLFILSGQSNMAGLNPAEAFTPTVEKALGAEHVIVVKDAEGGQPIRRWYKQWRPAKGEGPEATGDLYDRLMKKVTAAIEGQRIESVTFIWMQGECDAREGHGEVYAQSLEGLVDQLKADLGREQINVVIGRLSDFGVEDQRYPHWNMVREAQVAFVEATDNRAWVDTDDLNDGLNRAGKPIKNDLHYSAEGYKVLGERFAAAALELFKADAE